jgi:hypothetical protein
MTTLTYTEKLTVIHCAECSIAFALPDQFKAERIRDRQAFYCPRGHSQWFPGKTAEQLRKEAERDAANAKEDARIAKAEATRAKRELTAARKRAKAAMCPVPGCHRQIIQMNRHLHSKHPDYVHQP